MDDTGPFNLLGLYFEFVVVAELLKVVLVFGMLSFVVVVWICFEFAVVFEICSLKF